MSDMKITEELILKYQRCEATPSQERVLLDWLDESEDNRKRMDQANFLYCAALMNRKKKARVVRMRWWYSVAAALVVAVAGLAFWYESQKSAATEDNLAHCVTIEAPMGSQTRVSLADGSVVWLNSGSKLTYSETAFDRTVTLDGEGYFDVFHDEDNPFIVSVGELRVEVLGTVFNLRAYSSENRVQTSLACGSVRLSDAEGNRLALLRPGEQINCDAEGSNLNIEAVDAWKLLLDNYGVVTIPDASLTELCGILNRVYGVTVKAYEDDGTPVTFCFSKDSSIEEVVTRLSDLSGKSFDVEQNKI